MGLTKIILSVYGVLLLSGAYFGWKAGSQISLIMGIVSGIIVLTSVYLSQSHPALGYGVLTATSSLLAVVFLMRLLKTGKMMPSGMLLLMSVVALGACLLYFIKK